MHTQNHRSTNTTKAHEIMNACSVYYIPPSLMRQLKVLSILKVVRGRTFLVERLVGTGGGAVWVASTLGTTAPSLVQGQG